MSYLNLMFKFAKTYTLLNKIKTIFPLTRPAYCHQCGKYLSKLPHDCRIFAEIILQVYVNTIKYIQILHQTDILQQNE